MRTALVVLTLVLAGRVAGAGEATVTLKVEDTPLADVARTIAKQAEWVVVVSPACAEKRVTLDLKEAPARTALAMVAAVARMKVESLGEDAYWIGPALEAWEKKVHGALLRPRVDVEFEATSIQDALGYASSMTGVSIAVDPEVLRIRGQDELELSLHVEGIRCRDLLELVAQALSLAWDVRWGGVLVSTKERLESLPMFGMDPPRAGEMAKGEAELRKRLATEKVTFDFAETPIRHVLEFIRNVRNLDVVIDESARKAAEASVVTLKLTEVTVQQALDAILIPHAFRYELKAKGDEFQVTVLKAR